MHRGLRWVASIAFIVGMALVPSLAQITVTSFTTSVPVATLNSNFSTLGGNALNRTGGTVTGNIAANSGVTFDVVDVGAVLSGTGTPTFATVTVTNTGASALDVAGGINAGTGNVGIVDTTGKIPAISTTYFASLSGANLTGLAFSQLPTTWATPSYNAGDYTTNGAGGITVSAGDVSLNRYVVMGKTVHWNMYLSAVTLTAATGTEIRIAIPNAATAADIYTGIVNGTDNGTAYDGGVWQMATGSNSMKVFVNPGLVTAWAASANNTYIRFNATFEIQ